MKSPACAHHRPQDKLWQNTLPWLAAEPYRIFFVLGALWSLVGVALWPLFYHGWLPFHPWFSHARLMIEGFGGAFVVGFLGTAGPRMASAPKLTPWEVLWLIALHTGAAVLHLSRQHVAGDVLFAALLLSLLAGLLIRVQAYGKEAPPPQMLLALAGLLSGMTGAMMSASADFLPDPRAHALAGLLLYQGFLLPPVLGIGSFVFPRILGGNFGEPANARDVRNGRIKTVIAIILLTGSFVLEACGQVIAGRLLRAATCAVYLLTGVSWRKQPGQGTLASGLKIACLTGLAGLVLAGWADPFQRISVDHLLYIGGFGLLMLVVGSRVVFGHSGGLPLFAERSWPARFLVGLAVLTAATRAVPALAPQLSVSHHQYAALSWAAMVLLWLYWQRRRFLQRDPDE